MRRRDHRPVSVSLLEADDTRVELFDLFGSFDATDDRFASMVSSPTSSAHQQMNQLQAVASSSCQSVKMYNTLQSISHEDKYLTLTHTSASYSPRQWQ